jgi:WD40 repeat protein
MDDGRCIRNFVGHGGGVFPLHYVVSDDALDVDESSAPVNDRPASAPKIHDLIVTGSTDCTARSWSFETSKTVNVFRGHTGPITCVGTDVDDRILLTSSTDGSVRSWNFAEGQPLATFEGHRLPIVCMTVCIYDVNSIESSKVGLDAATVLLANTLVPALSKVFNS